MNIAWLDGFGSKESVKLFIVLAAAWCLLWLLPWVIWFQALPWLRIGLAFVVFIAPGIVVSFIFASDRFSFLTHFINGIAFSTLIISLLGLLGRIAKLSFDFIKPTFFVIGLMLLLALVFQIRSTHRLYKQMDYSFTTIFLLLAMTMGGFILPFLDRFGEDDFSTLANLTNWQYATPLNFHLVYVKQTYLDAIRNWIAMYPMVQAFLAEISGLHGLLLIGYYLGPVLVVIAILATYNFYEDLLQSEQKAAIALFLQITLLFLLLKDRQPGHSFFFRLAEDKSFAAFILAPIFFLGVNNVLQSFTFRNIVFALLVGWSLVLTHPVMLAYSIFIAGVYTTIVMILRKDFRTLGILLVLFVIIILPAASLRFVNAAGMGSRWAFDLESAMDLSATKARITPITGTPFYGFNLDTLKFRANLEHTPRWFGFLLQWLYLLILGCSFIWALFNLRKQIYIASFVAASALLVLLCAIPYTGWLVGYFVSARLLWRSPWMFPIGIVGFYLVLEFLKVILPKISGRDLEESFIQRVVSTTILVICFLLISYFAVFVYMEKWNTFKGLENYKTRLETYVALGNNIDKIVDEPSVFLANPIQVMNYLPGLSSDAKVVYFRQDIFTPYPVKRGDLKLVFSSDKSISIQKRVKILKKYEVQYILVNNFSQKKYYDAYPEYFTVQQLGPYWLLKFQEAIPSQ